MPLLIFETGPRKGETVPLDEEKLVVLGRDEAADVTVEDELVSRVHCKIRGRGGRFFVKDAGSSNGTFVNDHRVDLAELRPGDKIALGTTILTYLDEKEEERERAGGRELGGFRLLKRLGRGGMGTVFHAVQVSLNREVALKVLSPELARDPAFRERFLREARAAAQLNHPHIVQVYDAGEAEGIFFYAMEYMAGGTLEERILAQGPLPVDEALRYLLEAARGLDYAHGKGIVHRDVKPDNLMLTESGQLKIADLGLAHPARRSDGGRGILGTPHFLSPEQARNEPLDIRSDLYSLGASFYRMLTGETLYHGESAKEIVRKQVKEPPPSLRTRRPEVPRPVEAIYERLVAKDPDERFQSPAELVETLEKLRRGGARRSVAVLAGLTILALAGWRLFGPRREPTPSAPPLAVPSAARNGDGAELERELREKQALLDRQARENEAMAALLELDRAAAELTPEEALERYRAFAADHPDTDASRRAAERADALDREIAERRRREAAAVAAVEAALAHMEEAVRSVREGGDPVAAVTALLDYGGLAEEMRSRPAVEAARARLFGDLREALLPRIEKTFARFDEALSEGRFDDARSALADARALIALADELPDEAAPLRDALAEQLGRLEEARLGVAREEERARVAKRRRDLLRLRYSPDFERICAAAREQRFGEAETALEALLGRLETPQYRALVEVRRRDAEAARTLQERFLAALREGRLRSDRIRHPAHDREARIVGYDEVRGGLVLEVTRGAATSRSVVRLADFSSTEDFVALYLGRADDGPEHIERVVRALLFHRLGRLAERAARLEQVAARFSADEGWNDALRASLAGFSLPEVWSDTLRRRLGDESDPALAPVSQRLEREDRARSALLEALSPFLPDSEADFFDAVDRLTRFCEEYADSDAFLAFHRLLDGGAGRWEPALK